MKKTSAIIIFLCVFACLSAQEVKPEKNSSGKITGKDEVVSTPFFAGAVGWAFPFGEMGNRYSSFFNVDANLG